MKTVYIKGQQVQLKQIIGEGQEAVVYRLNPTLVVKIYRQPNDPQYQGNLQEQQGAKDRLRIIQQKLRNFPKNITPHVIGPVELAYNKNQEVIGYIMPYIDKAQTLLQYSDKTFRQQAGITNNHVMKVFQDLHTSVTNIHKNNAVIGDFNDMNILIRDEKAYLIDTDSWQYGQYMCNMYTDKYVDPLLCHSVLHNGVEMMNLHKPHNPLSDWYAFTTLLWKSLLFVDPYGGIYKPQNNGQKIKQHLRPLHRISVLHPDVIYPKHAYPHSVLPKNLHDWMEKTFVQDMRKVVPYDLLTQIHWEQCHACGIEYATPYCPVCHAGNNMILPQKTITGNVHATTILRTNDTIVYTTLGSQGLQYLLHKDNTLYRENGDCIVKSIQLSPLTSYRIDDRKNYVLHGSTTTCYELNKQPIEYHTDTVGNKTCFDSSSTTKWLIQDGQVIKEKTKLYASEKTFVAQGVDKQTLVWSNKDSCFILYKAGDSILNGIVVPSGSNYGIDVSLPAMQGTIIDTQCVLSDSHIWLLFHSKQQNNYRNICILLDYNGKILAQHEVDSDSDSWLGSIYGYTASGSSIFCPTDKGIVRISYSNGQWQENLFPNTEPYVHSRCQLIGSAHGIYVITAKTITLLTIK